MELMWIKVKLFFAKVWGFLKLFGGYLLFGFMVIVSVFFYSQLNGRLERMRQGMLDKEKAHRDNLDRLQAEIDAQLKARQEIEKLYTDLMAKIKREHSEGVQQIAETRDREVREIITRNRENPTAMATAMNSLFGVPVIALEEVPKS
jgi:hypothetical protein